MAEMEIPSVFSKTVELAIALGWEDIGSLPGCQEHQIDKHWWFAINPHEKPAKCSQCSQGASVPPYSIYFQFNGWPFAIVNAAGGMMGSGTAANEDNLMLALQRAIAEAGGAA
jgi:hypothetical protein